MKTTEVNVDKMPVSRRQLLLLPLALWGTNLLADTDTDTEAVTPLPSGACPLNSGGPSLLGSRWRLYSIYGNRCPSELEISMEVGDTAMAGIGGCNNYTASFQQVGNRGFKVVNIQQTRRACEVLRPAPGAPTINVGNWEGNYLRVLRRAGSVAQLGATLQCYDFNGKPSIVFAKRYGTG
ncbi:MAG: META domain-containing protein [Thiolinea sp.]